MDAPIGLFAPDGTTALLEFPHQAGMGCRAALHANQVPQSLLDPQLPFAGNKNPAEAGQLDTDLSDLSRHHRL